MTSIGTLVGGEKNLLNGFASASPVFGVAALVLMFVPVGFRGITTALPESHINNSDAQPEMAAPCDAVPREDAVPWEDSETRENATRRQSASAQYARAEEMRAALSSKAAEKRSLGEYKQVVASYRRVYLITPHASEVPDALLAVADRLFVINFGQKLAEGLPRAVMDDPEVRRVYMGMEVS